jgi:hypothetical protein
MVLHLFLIAGIRRVIGMGYCCCLDAIRTLEVIRSGTNGNLKNEKQ